MVQFFYNHFFAAMFILAVADMISEFVFVMALSFLLNLLLDSIDEKKHKSEEEEDNNV